MNIYETNDLENLKSFKDYFTIFWKNEYIVAKKYQLIHHPCACVFLFTLNTSYGTTYKVYDKMQQLSNEKQNWI